MSDDKNSKDYHDRDRINVHEAYEVEYWSKKFGVSPERLKKAVDQVGPMVKDVMDDLKDG